MPQNGMIIERAIAGAAPIKFSIDYDTGEFKYDKQGVEKGTKTLSAEAITSIQTMVSNVKNLALDDLPEIQFLVSENGQVEKLHSGGEHFANLLTQLNVLASLGTH